MRVGILAMSQTCAQCGMPIKEGYRFCSNCGASAGDASQSPALHAQVDVSEQVALDEQVVAPPTLYGPQTPMPPPSARNAGPSRAATMRPDPKEGGMYVPYGTEAETHLESVGSPRSRVMPVIVVAAVLLLGLAALTAYLLISPKPNTVVASCDLPVSPTEEDRVKQAVCLSNEEQIKAWRDLDVEVLKGTRTGEVLTENIEYVEDLKKRNLYAVPVLGSLEIREVKITGDTATVRTIETWSVTFHNRQDKSVVETKPPETLAETYHMVKQNGKWLVERLDFGENP
ncbi:MAG: zinc-ribbon domain-containing protein [Chloroflexia bacterium]